ncbi:CpaF family protein [Salana multivorans]
MNQPPAVVARPPALSEVPLLRTRTHPTGPASAWAPPTPPTPPSSTTPPGSTTPPSSSPVVAPVEPAPGAGAQWTGDEGFWADVDAIRARVSAALAQTDGALHSDPATQREIGRALVASHLREHQDELMRQGQRRWDEVHEARLSRAVMASLFGLGRLQPLVDIPSVENIEITGFDRVLLLHADGRREWAAPVARSDADLIEFLQFLASRRGSAGERPFTRANPTLSLSLPPDLRLQASAFVTPRPKVVIRRDRLPRIDLDGLRELGEIDDVLHAFLTAAVRAHKSIVVSGRGQGSGKSTLLRALIGQMDPWELIVTIETEYELRLDQVPDRHHRVTAFQARPGTGEVAADGRSAGEYTVSQLVYDSLRLNADRVVVGEVRGAEVLPMLTAMQMGNGSFSTIHANSARDVVERLVTCAVEDRAVTEAYAYRQVHQHIDLIVFLDFTYDPATRSRYRYLAEAIEVVAPDQPGSLPYAVNVLFAPGADGRAIPTGTAPTYLADLLAHGFDPALLAHTAGTWDRRQP